MIHTSFLTADYLSDDRKHLDPVQTRMATTPWRVHNREGQRPYPIRAGTVWALQHEGIGEEQGL